MEIGILDEEIMRVTGDLAIGGSGEILSEMDLVGGGLDSWSSDGTERASLRKFFSRCEEILVKQLRENVPPR